MIEISEHDSQWASSFDGLKNALMNALGDLALAVEHVGSTAVSGLAAKPIIDIDVVIDSPDLLHRIVEVLSSLGYIHQGDKGVPGREAFGRSGSDVPKDGTGRCWPAHHLYVCDKENGELQRHLAFRDFLRLHPQYARRYAQLKRKLAIEHAEDREAYTEGKTTFVAEVMAVIERKKCR